MARPRRPDDEPPALGSLSNAAPPAPGTEACLGCGGSTLTRLRMALGDGTDVTFVSCRACEHTAWIPLDGSAPLARDDVLRRSGRRG